MKKALKNFAVAALLVLGMAACNNMTSSKSSDSAGGSGGGSGGNSSPAAVSGSGTVLFAWDGFSSLVRDGRNPSDYDIFRGVRAIKPSATPPAAGVTAVDIGSMESDYAVTHYECDDSGNFPRECYIYGWIEGDTMYYFAYGYTDSGRKIPLSNDGFSLHNHRMHFGFSPDAIHYYADHNNLYSQRNDFREIDLSGFDTSRLTDMRGMFSGCSNLTTIRGLDSLNTSSVTDMHCMFEGCTSLTSLNLSGFDTSHVTDMQGMFYGCTALTSLDLSSWNTSRVTYMGKSRPDEVGMFQGCSSLTSLDLSGWDTSSVTDMNQIFRDCSSLRTIRGLESWNTSRVTNMTRMFFGCTCLTSLDLSSWNTASVTNMYGIFAGCSSLTSLDLSSWNTASVTYMEYMFGGCSHLATIYASPSFVIPAQYRFSSSIFADCTSLRGGAGTEYDASRGATYARIDGGPDSATPGYFTAK